MRVGIDASNLRSGGGVTHLVELLRHADPAAHNIDTIVVWSGKETAERLPSRPWLRVVHVPDLDRPLPFRLWWRRHRLPMEAQKSCDLLFHPGGGRSHFRPSVTMCRNMLPFDWREMRRYGIRYLFWRAAVLRFLLVRSFQQADGVIFLSEFALDRIGRRLLGHRVQATVVPHGISDRFRFAPRAQRPVEAFSEREPFRLLYTSIIDVYKHQWIVADAIIRLRGEGLPVSLDIVGPSYPPARKKLDDVLARGDANHTAVNVLGEVRHDALADLYRRADGFVFASTCENMPNILMEAMAAGLPIVCSNHPPMPDILGDGGLYFDAEDVEDVARVVRQVVSDAALRAAKARRASEIASAYSWERCSDETLSFLAVVYAAR